MTFAHKFNLLSRTLLCLVLGIPAGCAQVHSNKAPKVIEELPLDGQLRETSGLWCHQGQVYTINDSGNAATLYQLNEQGAITAKLAIKADNYDWEALAADAHSLYIGDIGDNLGSRDGIQIQRTDIKALFSGQPAAVETLTIEYQDRPKQRFAAYNHNYDAEGLVARDNDLLLFSKSWASDTTRVYRLDKQQPLQKVEPIATLETPGWVVTGASLDNNTGAIFLVGYQRVGVPLFVPLLARVTPDLSQVETYLLKGGQVEAVCALGNGEILYTQEDSVTSRAKLMRIRSPFKPLAE